MRPEDVAAIAADVSVHPAELAKNSAPGCLTRWVRESA
jgi:hypothetical protein